MLAEEQISDSGSFIPRIEAIRALPKQRVRRCGVTPSHRWLLVQTRVVRTAGSLAMFGAAPEVAHHTAVTRHMQHRLACSLPRNICVLAAG